MLWKKFFNKNIPTHWPLDHYQCPITGFKTGSCGFGCDCLPSVPQPMIPLNILYRRIWITVWGQVLLFIKCKKWCSSCVTAFHIPMLHGLAGPVVHLLLLKSIRRRLTHQTVSTVFNFNFDRTIFLSFGGILNANNKAKKLSSISSQGRNWEKVEASWPRDWARTFRHGAL